MRRLWLLSIFGLLVTVSAGRSAGLSTEYVGADRCKTCHPAACVRWASTPHAKANLNLPEPNRADARCVQCHGDPDPGTGGVQCESCHGGGKTYSEKHVMKDHELSRIVGLVEQSEKVCLRCHTESTPSVKPFAFERLWALIAHGAEDAPAAPMEESK
jgi:hypothetical protein